jgi:diguanylate cyclase (GGDEF)-like protein/PAS domain S-box-containing protein
VDADTSTAPVSIGYALIDRLGTVALWTAAAAEITGLDSEEMAGHRLLGHPATAPVPELSDAVGRLLAGSRRQELVALDGWRPGLYAWLCAELSHDDHVDRITLRFESRIETDDDEDSDDPFPIVCIDADGHIEAANTAASNLCELLGIARPEGLLPPGLAETAWQRLNQQEHAAVHGQAGRLSMDWTLRWGPHRRSVIAEGLIRDNREHYRRILRNSVDGMLESTRDGRLLYANQSLSSLLGYERPQKLVDSQPHGLQGLYLYPGDADHFLELLDNHRQVRGFEVPVRHRDGSVLWLNLNARSVRRARGICQRYVATVCDITARKAMESEARERQERYRTLVQAAGSAIIALDCEGIIEEWNPAAAEITGYSWSDAVGRPFARLLAVDRNDRSIEDRVRAWSSVRLSRDTEFTIRRQDGVRRVMLWHSRAQVDAHGQCRRLICIGQDVTERKAVELAMERAERQYRSLFENASDGIFQTDPRGRIQRANPALARLLGYADGSAMVTAGVTLDRMIAEPEQYRSVMAQLAVHGSVEGLELRVRREDGEPVWLRLSLRRICDEQPGGIEGTALDITESKRASERLEYLAHHDSLTGLPNRHAFQRRLLEQVLQVARGRRRSLALLVANLNNFKDVNDTLGHRMGDALLMRVGYELRQWCQRNDGFVARLGSDEFAIILAPADDEDAVRAAVTEVVRRIAQPQRLRGQELATTASVGYTRYPYDTGGHSPEDATQVLLQNADMALFWAKKDGRGSSRAFHPDMLSVLSARKALEDDLQHALPERQLVVHYQPIFNLPSRDLHGVEILLRWRHPTRGLVPPSEFIPAAERLGLIRHMSQWALETACRQVREWEKQGLVPDTLAVAVNISAHELLHSDLADALGDGLRQAGLAPSRLLLEITETSMITSPEQVRDLLGRLRELGMQVAIDDFGTGYSSLTYLKDLPVDVLKIDRSFVESITASKRNAAIVEAVVRLGHSLNLRVTAEGVETAEQLALLERQQVDHGQGFFLARPMPAEKLAEQVLGNGGGRSSAPAG